MKTRLLSLLLVILASVMPMKLWAAESNAEPYAVLSENNTKLTFYYDDQREARGGMSVAGSFDHPNYQPWHSQAVSITSAEFDPSFANCTTLTSTRFWFYDCKNMGAIFGIQYLKTDNVTDMWGMFGGCSGLTSLDLSGFNTANVKSMGSMFEGCSGLTKIFAGDDWNTALVTDGGSMFFGCTSLVGGAGTAYDANHTDHTYAHIDGGTANPGYFTAKDGQNDPLLARLYDNLALTTTDGNADGGNNDLSGSIDAAQTSLVRAMWNLQELPTDESYCVWMDSGIPALNTNTWSNSTQTQSMMGLYARLYHGIILANNYLANQNDGDLGKQAEARFLRALQYYYLMDHFGNVPLLTDTIDRQPLPVWEATPSDIELLTREEMFSYIENELQESLNSLPATNSYGRATATAARLLLARLYLNSEVYTGTARWQEARSYAESVINGGTFQLAPIYRNLFMGDNDSNGAQQEIILPAIYDANTRTDYGGTTFLVASSFANGEGDNGTTQVWAGNVSKPDFVNKFFTQTADIPYASPEQTASAANDDRALFYGINHSYELRNGDSFSDGFPYQKFTNVRSNGTSPVSSKFADTDFPLMRLGEAYLIAAEADARLNGSATSMQGTQYINMLRNRANAAASTTGYSLSDICDEWSREMGYEAVRRTTLIRFGRFGGQADYSWAWKGGSYDGSAFDAAKNTYPIPAVAVGGTPEPYAVLSQDNLTVTFYYDDQKASRGGIDFNNRPIVRSSGEKNPYGSAVTAIFDSSFANDTTLTSTAYWFMECRSLAEIRGIANLKTANVTDMGYMFYGCSGLTSLDVRGFNTDKVTSMGGMFDGCSGLTSLDVSNFNTAKVTSMSFMFDGCSGLTNLDVTNFNTDNVASMSYMFMGCSGLTSLDISGFKTDNVYDMRSMFRDCSALTTIYAGDGWNTANVTEGGSMFYNCTNLVGGSGTRYSADHSSYTYAHIDGGTSNPGYFTDKNATPVVDIAAKPTFAWEGDNLAISTTTEGASIYYAVKEFITEPSGNGSLSSPYNVAAALQYINTLDADTPSPDSVYIRGVVAEIREISTTYGNATFYITDDGRTTGDRLLAYRVLNVGNQRFTTENAFQVGDEVIIRGIVCNYRGTTPETYQNAAYIYANTTPEMNMLYENPIAVTDNVIVRAKATKQGMNDSEMAMFSVGSEPYAVLSENNTKLTFFYDDQKEARGGMSVGPFGMSYYDDVPWRHQRDSITTVEFDSSFANFTILTSTAYWFFGCSNMTSISGIEYLNTDNVMDMSCMFWSCGALTSLDVSGFNTENVTNMSHMFYGCSSLTSLDVSGFNTANVTDMYGMFYGCSGLTTLDVSHFNTTNVMVMGDMFWECSSLETLNVGGFNTSNVWDFGGMFGYCSSLKSLDISNFDTSSSTWMRRMFAGCSSMTNLDVSKLKTENVTDMLGMFEYCSNLTTLDVSHFNTEKVTEMGEMFYECSALTSLDVSHFNTANVTNMWGMFNDCSSLTTLDVSHFDTKNVTSMTRMFDNCKLLTNLDVSHFNTDSLTALGGMFRGCSSLTNLEVNSFNTSNVLYMWSMFQDCTSLTSLDLSGFNTANVTDMSGMFLGCSGLTNLDISGFNTANVTNMSGMFVGCSNLKILNLSLFNTQNVTNMSGMFLGCSGLTNLDISGFNTANVTNMNSMFGLCGSLTTLDLSNFNTAGVVDMHNMFRQSQQLKTIYVGDGWSTASVEKGDSIFYQCTSLIGGAGTVYDANHTDYTYAHIDGGASNPGYFTDKNAAPVATAEPYAVLSDNNTVLTFYYDDQKAARGGMSVGPFGYYEDVPWYSQRESITSAEFDPSFANCTTLTSTTNWFYGCWNMVSISGIQYLKTDNVTDMSSMFERCFSLTSLDLNNFNTENVTNMHSMFDSCSRLASLNVSSFNTNKVTNMGLMFSACYELTSLDVSGFNTDNVTDMHGMFGGSSGLTSLDLSHFNTNKVTTMTYMFEGCSGLTSLDLSSFNTENVTKFTNMFKECSNLKTIYVGSGWSTANVAEGTSMFYGCTNLVGGAGTAYDENHVDHTYAHIDGGTSNPGYFTAKNAPEGEATFDGKVARVSGERTLDEAFEQRGGRAEATRTIAAIIWNKESALTESDLQGITNPNLLVYVNEARLAPSNVQNVVINGLAREIVLTDAQDGNNDWYAPQAFVAERISYTRNFTQSTTKGTSRGWESIALPFDVQSIQHESKGVIAPFNNSASNKHFWLRRLTDNGLQAAMNIEANTPYIISMPNSEEYTADYNLNGRVTFSAQNIDVPATKAKVLALADSSIVMVPAMQRQSRSSSVWALNVGEVRGQYFEGSVFERDYRTVRPFEAYTIHRQENGQPAPRYVPIQEIAGVTGIETIDREPLTLNQWYDMQGRKLEGKPARKGVYISKGKKVVVK